MKWEGYGKMYLLPNLTYNLAFVQKKLGNYTKKKKSGQCPG
jgi:hypothetical protein